MKHVVIDGLARSGSTLLASLLGSQQNTFSSIGILTEPFAFHQGDWPMSHLEIQVKDASEEPIMVIQDFVTQQKNEIFKDFKNKSHGFSKEQWEDFFNMLKSYKDLDEFYEKIAITNFSENKISVLRWNHMLYHIKNWLSRQDHYWIAIIRDPRDRAASRERTFIGASIDVIIKETIFYYDQLSSVSHLKNLHIIYYEDLVANPRDEILKVFNFLNENREFVELKDIKKPGTNKSYRNEGWRVRAREGDHKVGEDYNGIYGSSVGQYKSHWLWTDTTHPADPNGKWLLKFKNAFNKIIDHYQLLERYKNA